MKVDFINTLREGLTSIGLSLDEDKEDKLYQFYEDVIETNKVMNLTAITEVHEAARKHFVDSLALIKALPDIATHQYTILDMGTGAGFPGVPLAIAFPNCKLVLTDSLAKRLGFIDGELSKLGIDNITTIHARAEELAHKPEYRKHFDVVVSRAVANLSTLSEYCLPFIHNDGMFIPYKAGNIEKELENANKAIKILGGKPERIINYELPGDGDMRTLICIRKTAETPKRYPRKAGTPSKEPIS